MPMALRAGLDQLFLAGLDALTAGSALGFASFSVFSGPSDILRIDLRVEFDTRKFFVRVITSISVE